MARINTLLLVFLISLTSYSFIQNRNHTEFHGQQIKSSLVTDNARNSNEPALRLSNITTQLEGIREQLSGLNSDASAGNIIAAKFDDVMNRLENIQQQISRLENGLRTEPIPAIYNNEMDVDRTEKNTFGNALVDSFIASGKMNGLDMVQLHEHLSKMDPDEQVRAMQRLAIAINGQRIDLDPNFTQ